MAAKANTEKKATAKRKAANGYKLPDPISVGEVLTDVAKKQWQIGPSIGVGGFGEIYSATDSTASPRKNTSYPYAIKIEPHKNGPLFVEMIFYMKVAKPEYIDEWMKAKKLRSLGMPRFLGSGSHEYRGEKYRFVVMEKFGKDVWSLFLQNNRVLPCATVFRIGIQLIDVLEYIHSKSYVHADVKGSNLLLGTRKGTENQVYLVDFGLASRYSTKEYKLDPKRAHNGTIEYTSRDAHMGVPTRRGDLEILGYNMLQWLASYLPWENCLSDPVKVQQQKVKYMDNIPELMKKCFNKQSPPGALVKYFDYVAKMDHDTEPDYDKCRAILRGGLKDLGCPVEGTLEFVTTSPKRKAVKDLSPIKPKKAKSPRQKHTPVSDEENESDDDNDVSVNGQHIDKLNTSTESDDIVEDSPSPKKRTVKPKSKSNPKKVTKPNWRDCPTMKASNVFKPGEYKRLKENEKTPRKHKKVAS